ncbi:hypothetical protein GCM10007901_45250 [Dyella acidisoli]|uniref:Uncharacterized protein n=1 Tax=Dyella acidisoli TaxID=1867834 RepID=A0ABQ5XZQ8_9GAMM|nr:hypothetical protein GCM10007901_45250 [Dyella acidisoli]
MAFDHQRFGGISLEFDGHIQHPSITDAWHGFDTALLIANVSQRAPQPHESLRQNVIADIGPTPHRGNQFVLSNNTLTVFD